MAVNEEKAAEVFSDTWKLELYLRLIDKLSVNGTLNEWVELHGQDYVTNFLLDAVIKESKTLRVVQ
ncbi:hypothetical protein [Evansella halocellulosilytica]|uniref:hypothetical protein n=1 Tax=Evansella halocellulosilytica TaxID=2011013 RepID=UPI000BB7A072|nr:hypothetical protein [Evansella halocellulosilytica]